MYYFKNGGREQALAKAESIVKELRKGADFEELAKVYSNDPYAQDGGNWPRVKRGDEVVWDFIEKGEALHKEVEDIAFSLELNEVSDPIPLDNFCQIVKVVAIQQGGEIPFMEVQENIRQKLRYQKIITALSRMREKLKQRSYIWPPNLFDESRDKY